MSTQKFEYKQVNLPGGDGMDRLMNEHGAEGWELVAWHPVMVQQRIQMNASGPMPMFVCMFKRPYANDPLPAAEAALSVVRSAA